MYGHRLASPASPRPVGRQGFGKTRPCYALVDNGVKGFGQSPACVSSLSRAVSTPNRLQAGTNHSNRADDTLQSLLHRLLPFAITKPVAESKVAARASRKTLQNARLCKTKFLVLHQRSRDYFLPTLVTSWCGMTTWRGVELGKIVNFKERS